jgi:hypothetical protein
MIEVVLAKPFTVEVRLLPVEDREFEVALLIADCSELVAITPLTFDVSITPEVERVFWFTAVEVDVIPLTEVVIVLPADETVLFEITLLVAVTPLIVVVRVLPDRDWANELIKLVKPETTPLTILWKLLVVVAKVLLLMIAVV